MDIAVPFRVPALRRTAEAVGLRDLPWVLQIHLKNHIALNQTQESNTRSLVEEISIGVFSTSECPVISMHTVTLWNTFSRYCSDWVWLLWECNGSTGRLFWACLCVCVFCVILIWSPNGISFTASCPPFGQSHENASVTEYSGLFWFQSRFRTCRELDMRRKKRLTNTRGLHRFVCVEVFLMGTNLL